VLVFVHFFSCIIMTCTCTRMAWAIPAVPVMFCPGLLSSYSGSLSPCHATLATFCAIESLGQRVFDGFLEEVWPWFAPALWLFLHSPPHLHQLLEWPIGHLFSLSCLVLSVPFSCHSHMIVDAAVTSGRCNWLVLFPKKHLQALPWYLWRGTKQGTETVVFTWGRLNHPLLLTWFGKLRQC